MARTGLREFAVGIAVCCGLGAASCNTLIGNEAFDLHPPDATASDAGNSTPDADDSSSDAAKDGKESGGDCVSPTIACGNECVDRRFDSRHCGACGRSCAGFANVVDAGSTCDGGSCAFVCVTGFGHCSTREDEGVRS